MDKAKRTTLQTQAAKTYNDAQKKQRPLSVPIHQSVNFEAVSSRQLGNDFRGKSEFVYQRFGHPTSRAAAEKIALLEGAELGLVFSSGMGAISTSLLTMAGSAGSHIVAQRAIFAQTLTFLSGPLHDLGVETTFIDARDLKQVRSSIRHNTRLIYIESPSNPLLNVTDISAVSAIAKVKNMPLMIDGTFASPYLQNPIALGASVVLHSATKFLGGHSDVLCGAAAGDRDPISKIAQMQILLGTTLDPHACWLLLRGIKTLGVRVQKQSDSALAIARFLETKDVVENYAIHGWKVLPGMRPRAGKCVGAVGLSRLS
jgi:cystathionine beta-lyase/cystathionine gamma-synthase